MNKNIFWKSFYEVLWLTSIAFLPLLINVIIKSIELESIGAAFQEKVLPIELLTFCLSFLAPSMYLLIKMDGNPYRLPYLHLFSLLTIVLYTVCLVLNIITKNDFGKNLNNKFNSQNLYLHISLIVLLITILFRIYTLYHNKNSSSFFETREKEQQDFNLTFKKSIDE